jgi:hypothetical protein
VTAMPRTVIDKDGSVLTVINEFHVTREQQEQIVRRFPPLMSDVVSKVPGFVSGNLHISADGERVLTYYQWQSKDAYDIPRRRGDCCEGVGRHLRIWRRPQGVRGRLPGLGQLEC